MEKVTKSTGVTGNQVCRECESKDRQIAILQDTIQVLRENVQFFRTYFFGEEASRQPVSMTVVGHSPNPVDGGKGNSGNLSLVR